MKRLLLGALPGAHHSPAEPRFRRAKGDRARCACRIGDLFGPAWRLRDAELSTAVRHFQVHLAGSPLCSTNRVAGANGEHRQAPQHNLFSSRTPKSTHSPLRPCVTTVTDQYCNGVQPLHCRRGLSFYDDRSTQYRQTLDQREDCEPGSGPAAPAILAFFKNAFGQGQ